MLLTHGVGTRTNLPVPTWLAASGAGLAVLISFAALTLLWRKPLLGGDTAGCPIPGPVASVLDSSAIRPAAAALAAFAYLELVLPGRSQPDVVAWFITLYAIVTGHLLATVSAHYQAMHTFPAAIATRSQ